MVVVTTYGFSVKSSTAIQVMSTGSARAYVKLCVYTAFAEQDDMSRLTALYLCKHTTCSAQLLLFPIPKVKGLFIGNEGIYREIC
jgi:hypothetical protein